MITEQRKKNTKKSQDDELLMTAHRKIEAEMIFRNTCRIAVRREAKSGERKR
jgi:hypothetical protein